MVLRFDALPLFENGRCSAEVDIGRCDVVQACVVSAVVIVRDELPIAVFELTWLVVVLQQDPIFHRAVISLVLPCVIGW